MDEVPKQRSTRRVAVKRESAQRQPAKRSAGRVTATRQGCRTGTSNHAELARELVLAAWPGIVQGLIKKARSGGYQHTKLLIDLSGLTIEDESQLTESHKQQLCDALLEGLENSFREPENSVKDVQVSTVETSLGAKQQNGDSSAD